MTELSRVAFGEKKNDPLPVRFTERQAAFISGMTELHDLNSTSDYLRYLVDEAMKQTARDLNLMANAIGAKVNTDHLVSGGNE